MVSCYIVYGALRASLSVSCLQPCPIIRQSCKGLLKTKTIAPEALVMIKQEALILRQGPYKNTSFSS